MPAIDQHAPIRSCIGCRRRRPHSELVRVTRVVDGSGSATPVATPATVVADGPSSGRGAWLCRSEDERGGSLLVDQSCLDTAITRGQFARAWRCALEPHDVEAIRAALRRDEHHD